MRNQFLFNSFINKIIQLFVCCTLTNQIFYRNFTWVKKTHFKISICCNSQSVTRRAKFLRHWGNKTYFWAIYQVCVCNCIRIIIEFLNTVFWRYYLKNLFCLDHLFWAPFVFIKGHELNESHFNVSVFNKVYERQNFIIVKSPHEHAI